MNNSSMHVITWFPRGMEGNITMATIILQSSVLWSDHYCLKKAITCVQNFSVRQLILILYGSFISIWWLIISLICYCYVWLLIWILMSSCLVVNKIYIEKMLYFHVSNACLGFYTQDSNKIPHQVLHQDHPMIWGMLLSPLLETSSQVTALRTGSCGSVAAWWWFRSCG